MHGFNTIYQWFIALFYFTTCLCQTILVMPVYIPLSDDTPPRSSQGHTLASTSTTRSSTSITQPIARSSQRHTLATTTRSTTSIAPSTYRTRSTVSMKAHSTIAQFTTIRGPVTSRTNGSSVTTTTRHATMQTSHVVTDNDVTTSHVVTDNDVTARGADVNTNAVENTIRDVTSVTPEVAGSEEDTLSSIEILSFSIKLSL